MANSMSLCFLWILLHFAVQSTLFGGRAAASTNNNSSQVCGYPGNNANSLTNFTGNWVNPGTVVTYACDAGYQMFAKSEHRVCQHGGTWTSEAPICAKSVSFGKRINCTSLNCGITDPNMLIHMVDDNDNTCFSVPTKASDSASNLRLDLLEQFEIRAFRFVLRGKAAQYANPEITLENTAKSVRQLKHTECTIRKEALSSKGADGYVMTILPNRPQWARYVNININHKQMSEEEIAFCETQIFADNAPSVQQCFYPSTAQESDTTLDVQSPARNTVIYGGQCYTFNSKVENEWNLQREHCKTVYQGQLVHDVTNDVNELLKSYALAKGSMNNYWMGGYVEKLPTAKGGYTYIPYWITGNQIKDLFPNTKQGDCLSFASPKGIWMFYPCYYRTGSICQTDIKRCGNPELREHVKMSPVWKNDIGVTIQHSCPSGYELDGHETRTCEQNGKWSGTPPDCVYGGVKGKSSWTAGVIAGVVVAVLLGILLVILILIIILRKYPTFKHKMSLQSESVEALESGKQARKKERSSLNDAASSGAQNYESLLNQEAQQAKQ